MAKYSYLANGSRSKAENQRPIRMLNKQHLGMWLRKRNSFSSVILVIIYLFFGAECLFFGLFCPSECRILALLFFGGLIVIGLPILNRIPILKFSVLGVAIIATICYTIIVFAFFGNYYFIFLSVVNVIAFVSLIILRKKDRTKELK